MRFPSFLLVFTLFALSMVSGCGGGGGNSASSDVPTSIVAVASDGQVTLQWGAMADASAYTVYLSSDSNFTTDTYQGLADGRKVEGASSPVTINGLVNGRRYYFLVTATGADGESGASSMVDAVPHRLVTAIIHVTGFGAITLDLYQEQAPLTVTNFVTYAEAGFYNNTLLHRVIDGFMIQGGGFEPGMVAKTTGAPIINEANNGLLNVTGTIAMARTADPHSATSQFFINVADNTFLDYVDTSHWGYAVFGQVTAGMDVVNAIKGVSTHAIPGYADVPVSDVLISQIEIILP